MFMLLCAWKTGRMVPLTVGGKRVRKR
jgi:hypothetical protein